MALESPAPINTPPVSIPGPRGAYLLGVVHGTVPVTAALARRYENRVQLPATLTDVGDRALDRVRMTMSEQATPIHPRSSARRAPILDAERFDLDREPKPSGPGSSSCWEASKMGRGRAFDATGKESRAGRLGERSPWYARAADFVMSPKTKAGTYHKSRHERREHRRDSCRPVLGLLALGRPIPTPSLGAAAVGTAGAASGRPVGEMSKAVARPICST